MYDNKVVSVIIPVYNSEEFIAETIESALSQTYQEIEIIIVDDCSKDKSSEIIIGYKELYPDRITYHVQEKNMGVGVARNTALKIAKGRYVAFLDSDDLWYPNKIGKQIELMNKKRGAISYTAIEMIDGVGNQIKGKRPVKDIVDYRFLLKNTMIATSSVLIDRNIIGDFQMPIIRSGQDYATWLNLMRNGIDAYGINEILVKYRVRSNSLSSGKLKSVKQVWTIQTKQEGISMISAAFNVCYFSLNALKKYYT